MLSRKAYKEIINLYQKENNKSRALYRIIKEFGMIDWENLCYIAQSIFKDKGYTVKKMFEDLIVVADNKWIKIERQEPVKGIYCRIAKYRVVNYIMIDLRK